MKRKEKKIENANYYGLRTVMNIVDKSNNYESMLRMADMRTIEQSLILFLKFLRKIGQATVHCQFL